MRYGKCRIAARTYRKIVVYILSFLGLHTLGRNDVQELEYLYAASLLSPGFKLYHFLEITIILSNVVLVVTR